MMKAPECTWPLYSLLFLFKYQSASSGFDDILVNSASAHLWLLEAMQIAFTCLAGKEGPRVCSGYITP